MSARIWVGVLVGMMTTAAVACGSSDESSFPDGGTQGSDGDFDAAGLGETGSLSGSDGGGATGTCKPLTCNDLGDTCGPAGDGCGNVIDCGTCTAPETCGGGGLPSKCGGTAGCVPKSCTDLDLECGPAGDGCGNLIATCGTCMSPAICGGAGPSKCGGGMVSDAGVPLLPDGGVCHGRTTCVPGECGPVADGCGGVLTCASSCPTGQTCGGGTAPSMCGAPSCTKATCASAGANCGQIADGCGGIVDCGGKTSCTGTDFCGGGGPNKCGAGTPAPTCVNFCLNQNACTSKPQKTTLIGHVYAPNGTLPLPNALVYVPNKTTTSPYGLSTFTDGIGTGGTCESCSAAASGEPLVQTKSLYDGSFTLVDVPVGVPFPLVIQLGRWRRLVTVAAIPAAKACTTIDMDANGTTKDQTRFPTIENEGNAYDNIPKFAISTGAADALECVLSKIGVASSEFKNGGSASGRIQIFKNAVDSTHSGTGPGATLNGSTPAATNLYNTSAAINSYDAVILACRGGDVNEDAYSSSALTNIYNYANNGGRLFTTHYGFDWLDPEFETSTPTKKMWSENTATWVPNSTSASWAGAGSSTTAAVSTSVSGGIFAKWLDSVGALSAGTGTSNPRVKIFDPRNDVDIPLKTGVEQWITASNSSGVTDERLLQMAFNTPVAATTQCGRVIYSDFHVSTISGSSSKGLTFPNECTNGFSAQEKILAYMIFDLTSCITPSTPPPPPTCTPKTCTGLGAKCGPAGDGCGNTIDCGTCPGGMICTGTPGMCITPPCSASSCPSEESCGPIPNGCGGTVDCGPCSSGLTCGGAGPSLCGATTCSKTTCAAQGISCGPGADGCGGLIDCGTCPPGMTCGGGGTSGACGAPTCTPRTCASAGANCGPIGDGCGGIVQCGNCASGQTCGGGGTPNQCSSNIPR